MAVTVGDGISIGVHVGGGGGEVRVGFMVGEASSVAAAIKDETAFIVGASFLVEICVGAGEEVEDRLGTGVFSEDDSREQEVRNSR